MGTKCKGSSPIILLITEVSFLSSPLLMPSNAITDCPIYRVLWDLAACWGKEVHTRWMLSEVQSAVGITSHSDIFHLTFFKHCVMVFWGWMLQKSSIGYHIWCPECVTVNGAVWERWVYQILALLGFTHIKLFSVEHEQLWIPKKAILARWWQRQFPNIRDSRNDSQGRVTLVAQASEPRLSFTWCSLITCMRYGLHQMYPVTH